MISFVMASWYCGFYIMQMTVSSQDRGSPLIIVLIWGPSFPRILFCLIFYDISLLRIYLWKHLRFWTELVFFKASCFREIKKLSIKVKSPNNPFNAKITEAQFNYLAKLSQFYIVKDNPSSKESFIEKLWYPSIRPFSSRSNNVLKSMVIHKRSQNFV